MTTKEAFRRGFLLELARRGISPVELSAHLEKRAEDGKLDKAFELGKSGVKTIWDIAKAVALIGGGLTGWNLAKSHGASKSDLEALEATAMAADYADAVRELKRERGEQKKFGPLNVYKYAAALMPPSAGAGPVASNINRARATVSGNKQQPAAPSTMPNMSGNKRVGQPLPNIPNNARLG